MTAPDLQTLRRLADAGNEDAADRLATLAAERGDIDTLAGLADEGNPTATSLLSEILSGG